ncbi:hypothetical protein V1512DRAFT_260411 [Lipomyces arxii]|uniref:uncharacterized protein n=1 Tax=Lipomyces arxii TaxID=56418 RepID=UPI0034CF3EEA
MISAIFQYLNVNEKYVRSQWALTQKFVHGDISPTQFYFAAHPYTSALAIHVLMMIYTFVVGTARNEHSQVDRMWSMLPTSTLIYYLVYTYLKFGMVSTRQLLYTSAMLIWSVRLTYNFARKGGYNGVEDYRWQVLRSKIPKAVFIVFSLVFISIIQLLLLLNITAPAALFTDHVHKDLMPGEYFFLAALLCVIGIEGVSDEYQWDYQSAKHEYKASGNVSSKYTKAQLERGFCAFGPFKYSRHPNFIAEQFVWIIPYLWSLYVIGERFNWTIIGAIGYVVLFQGSTTFTEYITRQKYPVYNDYIKMTGRFFPSLKSHWVEPAQIDSKTKIS